MPVIVVGADTDLGTAIIEALRPEAAEVRAFVTDVDTAERLKARGVKVAVGDVSDGSHVGAAARNAFCAILLAEATTDDRERAFAATPSKVVTAWADALRGAGTARVIWVGDLDVDPGGIGSSVGQFAAVTVAGRTPGSVVSEVLDLEGARRISDDG